jgi:CRP-like cAMP-binding protein
MAANDTLNEPGSRDAREGMFPRLTSAQMARMAAHGRSRPFQAGEILIQQGDQATRFYTITAGEVEIVRCTSTCWCDRGAWRRRCRAI